MNEQQGRIQGLEAQIAKLQTELDTERQKIADEHSKTIDAKVKPLVALLKEVQELDPRKLEKTLSELGYLLETPEQAKERKMIEENRQNIGLGFGGLTRS
ncbi:MAG: hypothetical protein UX89_C0022G0007 [Parcubacteria group bacterium GW2011_GWA2_47_16]|nr:MAG: hypothetical protein UX89_C0022G0007 [Parcubacteria group bacterium GW2011_GWA2_47_16]